MTSEMLKEMNEDIKGILKQHWKSGELPAEWYDKMLEELKKDRPAVTKMYEVLLKEDIENSQ